MNKEQLWRALVGIVPALSEAAVLWWSSGSSYIYNGDHEIQGLRGQRLYILIRDLGDLVRFGEVLAQRLWLAGLGRIEISKSGSLLVRNVFDVSMFQAARLDFAGGASCFPPLIQRRGDPEVLNAGGWLDTATALPNLTSDERQKYDMVLSAARDRIKPEAEQVKTAWASAQSIPMISRLVRQGVSEHEAKDRAERVMRSALGGVLLGDFSITLADGGVVTIGDVLDNRSVYHGVLTLDPLEPEYLDRKVVGKLYLYGGAPTLTSRAHGGANFRLLRQPARMFVTRGRKADLVDQIIDRMEREGDLFLLGGVLVCIENGESRVLNKPGLLHLLQTRIAFFGMDRTGKEIPVDLPGEVADMILSRVGC